jgi:ribosome-binding protein aMBF1 (putative translation factor)
MSASSSLQTAYQPLFSPEQKRTWYVLEPPAPYTSSRAPSDARKRVSINLRRLRKANGWSQEQLAEAAQFHRTYVSQLERCVTNISINGLDRLAEALRVDITELLKP